MAWSDHVFVAHTRVMATKTTLLEGKICFLQATCLYYECWGICGREETRSHGAARLGQVPASAGEGGKPGG